MSKTWIREGLLSEKPVFFGRWRILYLHGYRILNHACLYVSRKNLVALDPRVSVQRSGLKMQREGAVGATGVLDCSDSPRILFHTLSILSRPKYYRKQDSIARATRFRVHIQQYHIISCSVLCSILPMQHKNRHDTGAVCVFLPSRCNTSIGLYVMSVTIVHPLDIVTG